MNWVAIGAIGDITGALAVVATLGYLAVQIRQNTKVAKSSARQAIAEMTLTASADMVNDPSLAEAFLKDLEGGELSRLERLRLYARSYMAMRNWENIHYQYLSGMLDNNEWAGFRLNLKATFEWPTLQDYWENEQQFFSRPFQEEVARICAELETSDQAGLSHAYVLGEGRDT